MATANHHISEVDVLTRELELRKGHICVEHDRHGWTRLQIEAQLLNEGAKVHFCSFGREADGELNGLRLWKTRQLDDLSTLTMQHSQGRDARWTELDT